MKKIIIVLLALLATSAQAAGNLFSPVEGDLSIKMLGKIFGGLLAAGGADPLKDLISTFNGAVLAVGGVLVAYTIFAGVIGTAHDGEMLGKKFSSVWVPIRTALGTALVIPINGYCGMQILVMWLVVQGIGLADTVWSSLVEGDALMTGSIQATAYQSPEALKLANSLAVATICVKAAQMNSDINNMGETWSAYPSGNNIYFGMKDSYFRKTSCGQLALIDETQTPIATAAGEFSNVAETIGTAKSNLPIIQAHNAAAKQMISSLSGSLSPFVVKTPLGDTFRVSSDTLNYPTGAIKSAVEEYNKTISDAVKAYYSDNDASGKAIKENASKDGWLTAGAWFIKLAGQMSKADIAVGSTPTAEANKNIAGGIYREVNEVIGNAANAIALDKMNEQSGIAKQNALDGNGADGFGATFYRWVGKTLTTINLEDISTQTNVHPVIQLKAMGDRMIKAATASIVLIIGGFATAMGASGIGGAALGGGITGATQTFTSIGLAAAIFITPIVFLLFSTLLTLGFFMSYYIPMLPFLIWLGCIVGWFIMVMEAIIAAPLWAVMHLHPSGDDLTGKGGQGYMLVLGLLVRPTLMIFGLACALILSGVIGQLVNSLFYDTFKMSRGGDSIGLFGTLLAYVLYTTVMLTMTKKLFQIIHIVPDQLLQWIGGGRGQLGETAGTMVSGTEGQFMKAGALAGAVGQQSLNKGLEMGQRRAHMAEDRDNRASEAAGRQGMTLGQAKRFAARGGAPGENGQGDTSLSAIQAIEQMGAARSELAAQGATGQELAQFNESVDNSDKPLGEAIREGKQAFQATRQAMGTTQEGTTGAPNRSAEARRAKVGGSTAPRAPSAPTGTPEDNTPPAPPAPAPAPWNGRGQDPSDPGHHSWD